MAEFGAELAPRFKLLVAPGDGSEYELKRDVASLVTSIEYEMSMVFADKLTLRFDNPDHRLLEHRAIQPGNELSVILGYGNNLQFIGRVVLQKHMPNFPEDGIPTLEVVGYDRSYDLMEEGAAVFIEKSKSDSIAEKSAQRKKKKGQKKQPEFSATYADKTHSEIVEDKARKYGFKPDVDSDGLEPDPRAFQKRDITDYAFIRGLANLNQRDFWVDYDAILGEWVLHWKDWGKVIQEKAYNFVYREGGKGTLLSFEPEYGLPRQRTGIQVIWTHDIEEEAEEQLQEESAEEDPRFTTTDALTTGITSGTKLRIAVGETSVEVVTDRKFTSRKEAEKWAKAWAQQRFDDFIVGSGSTIGLETLRARQAHTISGISKRLSGSYLFTRVVHRLDSSGYRCEFSANRIMDGSPRQAFDSVIKAGTAIA